VNAANGRTKKMEFSIGEKIIYKDEDNDGVYFIGEIVDVWRNRKEMITGYFAALNSGLYVNIDPDYLEAVN
jgi:UDP-2,3-diacylglucosamine pyrophosphatase LpxH